MWWESVNGRNKPLNYNLKLGVDTHKQHQQGWVMVLYIYIYYTQGCRILLLLSYIGCDLVDLILRKRERIKKDITWTVLERE